MTFRPLHDRVLVREHGERGLAPDALHLAEALGGQGLLDELDAELRELPGLLDGLGRGPAAVRVHAEGRGGLLPESPDDVDVLRPRAIGPRYAPLFQCDGERPGGEAMTAGFKFEVKEFGFDLNR